VHGWALDHDYESIRMECHNQHRPMLHLGIAQGYDIAGIESRGVDKPVVTAVDTYAVSPDAACNGVAAGPTVDRVVMTVRPERTQGLGRGLAALIPQRAPGLPGPVDIAVDRIRPNPFQPRRHFDPAELATLTASVREHGILQPVLVTEAVDGYELVAGERRLRAAIAAGLERIPAIVRQFNSKSER
jgi:hypothetical protein